MLYTGFDGKFVEGNMELPKRLAALAACVLQGKTAADIGTDHAYLPIYLIEEGICNTVIATDLREGPYRSAEKKIREHGLTGRISLRLGDGLKPLVPGEAETVILAGLGGNTIRGILSEAPQVLSEVKRLVLQPMTDAGDLRLWLVSHGWKIADEHLVEDEGRIYVIIVAEHGHESVDNPVLLELGPRLLEKGGPLLEVYLNGFIEKYERILAGLARAQSSVAGEKAAVIMDKLAKIKEVAACL